MFCKSSFDFFFKSVGIAQRSRVSSWLRNCIGGSKATCNPSASWRTLGCIAGENVHASFSLGKFFQGKTFVSDFAGPWSYVLSRNAECCCSHRENSSSGIYCGRTYCAKNARCSQKINILKRSRFVQLIDSTNQNEIVFTWTKSIL